MVEMVEMVEILNNINDLGFNHKNRFDFSGWLNMVETPFRTANRPNEK